MLFVSVMALYVFRTPIFRQGSIHHNLHLWFIDDCIFLELSSCFFFCAQLFFVLGASSNGWTLLLLNRCWSPKMLSPKRSNSLSKIVNNCLFSESVKSYNLGHDLLFWRSSSKFFLVNKLCYKREPVRAGKYSKNGWWVQSKWSFFVFSSSFHFCCFVLHGA